MTLNSDGEKALRPLDENEVQELTDKMFYIGYCVAKGGQESMDLEAIARYVLAHFYTCHPHTHPDTKSDYQRGFEEGYAVKFNNIPCPKCGELCSSEIDHPDGVWPEKKHYTEWEANTLEGMYRRGFNDAHYAFTKILKDRGLV